MKHYKGDSKMDDIPLLISLFTMILCPVLGIGQCTIHNTITTPVICFDNSTPNDFSDDSVSFGLTIMATNNNGNQTWVSDAPDGASGTYGVETIFGPYPITLSGQNIMIWDILFPTCLDEYSFNPIPINYEMIQPPTCHSAGTPSDPSDDTYVFILNVSSSQPNGRWRADDPNKMTGDYNVNTIFGPYLIDHGDFVLTLHDLRDTLCKREIPIEAPARCSDVCAIRSTGGTLCDDNGTPDDASDDLFYAQIIVLGNNTGSQWKVDYPFAYIGEYNVQETIGPFAVSGGDVNFLITDYNDPKCTTVQFVAATNVCSDTECNIISLNSSNVRCEDNGTLDTSDDRIVFELSPQAVNTNGIYSITVSQGNIDPGFGDFGTVTSFSLGAGSSESGSVIITVMDTANNGCLLIDTIQDPGVCKDLCTGNVDSSSVSVRRCKGSGFSITLGNVVFDQNNPNGSERLVNSLGCDSIIWVDLQFVDMIETDIDSELCVGNSLLINKTVYDENNPQGTEIIQLTDECDSIIYVNLTFGELETKVTGFSPFCTASDNGIIKITEISPPNTTLLFSLDDTEYLPLWGMEADIVPNLVTANYTLYLKDQRGCINIHEVDLMTQNRTAFVTLGNNLLVDPNRKDSLFINTNLVPDVFTWSHPELLSCTVCLNPEIIFIEQETVLTLTLTGESGCQVSEQVILIPSTENKDVYIPEAISMNGDNLNDFFTVFGLQENVQTIKSMVIYDRRGRVVFNRSGLTINKEEEGWDGVDIENTHQSDVYIYFVEVQFSDGDVELFQGDITVLR